MSRLQLAGSLSTLFERYPPVQYEKPTVPNFLTNGQVVRAPRTGGSTAPGNVTVSTMAFGPQAWALTAAPEPVGAAVPARGTIMGHRKLYGQIEWRRHCLSVGGGRCEGLSLCVSGGLVP